MGTSRSDAGTKVPAALPVRAALNGKPPRVPPANRSTIWRSVIPSGASKAPGRLTHPLTVNILVPALSAVPTDRNQAAPRLTIGGTRHRVSTLLIRVGLPSYP